VFNRHADNATIRVEIDQDVLIQVASLDDHPVAEVNQQRVGIRKVLCLHCVSRNRRSKKAKTEVPSSRLFPADRLQLALQILSRHVTFAEYPGKQARSNRLASMHWNDGTAAIGMSEEMMTAPDANHSKPQSAEGLDQSCAGD
jgi:hypothetical protein